VNGITRTEYEDGKTDGKSKRKKQTKADGKTGEKQTKYRREKKDGKTACATAGKAGMPFFALPEP